MPIRFLILWGLLSVVAYLAIYTFRWHDRKVAWKLGKSVAVSVIGGGLALLPLFFLNHLSGL